MNKNLIERLNKGPVICAEGFLFEIEKRWPCDVYVDAEFKASLIVSKRALSTHK